MNYCIYALMIYIVRNNRSNFGGGGWAGQWSHFDKKFLSMTLDQPIKYQRYIGMRLNIFIGGFWTKVCFLLTNNISLDF